MNTRFQGKPGLKRRGQLVREHIRFPKSLDQFLAQLVEIFNQPRDGKNHSDSAGAPKLLSDQVANTMP